jgi:hypothetical protein
MRHRGTPRRDARHIRRGQEIAMRQNRPRPEQPETIQAFGIRHAMPGQNMVMFPIAFGRMGLHVAAG